MADLLSSLTIAGKVLSNRMVMAPTPSGFASADGFVSADLIAYYARRAQGGVGLILSEPLLVVPPAHTEGLNHLGGYADAFVPRLRQLVGAVHAHHTRLLLSLECPTENAALSSAALSALREQFILAAWRTHCAGADGVLLSSADGGVLHSLISPSRNHRHDSYGGDLANRMRLALEVIEGIRTWIGPRFIIGFRLPAEEFCVGGMGMQDARVVARRVIAAGVKILDVTVAVGDALTLARFPGWAVPLANGIKRVTPEVPVIGFGVQGDHHVADSLIRDGSIDLVALDHTLRYNPDWPHRAQDLLDG
ncbi:NADH:flavin oxidoreductase/NADH oxidase [Oscillochloris trichoides DG-6]|uniref:NADH:flavin oxidoreductase/NADH oxidase n=1 Tax=Oscillochloris trichoides DG-6 TaxID=765420 RepID=E1IEH3_9CHLR|nr:NADH:flavin oxidoreductase/NADH oxidase [Oscillochloris trichoides]EFO80499.1 NADH:flavin oxidoreductase/NADH oxidase [Oscillochloris trichoides DG-6]